MRGVRIEASSRIHGRLVIANMRLTVKERCSLFARIQSASWVRGGVILVYKPTPLTDQQLAEPNLKRSVAGAALMGHLDKLPKSHLQVKWEVTTTGAAPDISMKPIRPKLWIMGKITMEADYFYEVK